MSKYKRSGRPQSSRCKRTTRPRLEALESRLVLSSTVLPTVPSPAPFAGAGNESAIVEGLYHNILGRVADSAGLAQWTAQLQAGESAAQVAGQFFQSTEYTTDVVESYYTTYLGRVGDTAEVNSWVATLQAGASEEQVAAAFLSSPEYSAKYVTNGAFVQSLYENVLGRAGDQAGINNWTQVLAAGTSRAAVAASFIGSPESSQISIDGDYNDFLGRVGDTAGVNSWVAQIQNGPMTMAEVAAAFAGSPEYATRASQKATPTITSPPTASGITYGQTLADSTLSGGNASVAGSFTWTTPTTAPGAGSPSESVTFTPTDTTDYTSPTATATINVAQATPTITWANPADITYGTALGDTQLDATATGIDGTSLAGTFAYTPAAGTVLGTGKGQTLSTTFTPTDTTDYTSPTATATINVAQATPTITWANPADITYGTALGDTQLDATATGIDGTSLAGTFAYTPAAGTVLGTGKGQTLSTTFTPTDTTDYTSPTATATINVAQATPTITWANPADITYGTALGDTQLDATATGIDGTSLAGTFAYTPAAGTVLGTGKGQTLSTTFTPTDTTDYTSPTATATINVAQATPTITWANPADITYGTALGDTQLDATATGIDGTSLAGTFAYTPAAGTVLGTGKGQTLSTTFTPTDTTDYTSRHRDGDD